MDDVEPRPPGDRGPEPDAPDVAAGLSEALEGLLAWTRRAVPPDGLSLSAAATLTRIARRDVEGISALAAMEGVTQPAMSQMIARLERDGLVDRAPHPADARAVRVALTARGREVVAARRADRVRALAELLARASGSDAGLIAAAVPAMVALVRPGAAGAPAPPARSLASTAPSTTPSTTPSTVPTDAAGASSR